MAACSPNNLAMTVGKSVKCPPSQNIITQTQMKQSALTLTTRVNVAPNIICKTNKIKYGFLNDFVKSRKNDQINLNPPNTEDTEPTRVKKFSSSMYYEPKLLKVLRTNIPKTIIDN